MRPKSSLIWTFFYQVNIDHAKCKQCDQNFSRKGGGTTSLKLHLKSKHSDKYKELLLLEQNRQQKPQTSKQLTPLQKCQKQLLLTDSLKNNSTWDDSNVKQKEMDRLVAEMISLQNLPFSFGRCGISKSNAGSITSLSS
ncbi:unnamed protein product [Pieris macdunnoughi]|uniref:BED-type domain-containing protein n=1 Tax=Pieris macdunnoughi TaxID=345717 RepID=A0A821TMX1_9NEOP|nr:unnamed protein product [Pieris macdunnoughi]